MLEQYAAEVGAGFPEKVTAFREGMAVHGRYRHPCPDCGSPIYSQRAKVPEMMVLKVGTLDAPNDMKLVMNIWTNSARPWVHRDPATEQHPENRPVKA